MKKEIYKKYLVKQYEIKVRQLLLLLLLKTVNLSRTLFNFTPVVKTLHRIFLAGENSLTSSEKAFYILTHFDELGICVVKKKKTLLGRTKYFSF
jgi:hypothetical protein